ASRRLFQRRDSQNVRGGIVLRLGSCEELMSDALAIETHDLTKQYSKTAVVNHLNLAVPKHQITAFVGRNGAGKSTTIKMLVGITTPSSGTGSVLGKAIDDAEQSRE